jgi:hypothetical protein
MSGLPLRLFRISIVIAVILGASVGRASQLQLPSSAVSITATPEPDLYLIADYSHILLFDKHDGSITRMSIVGATRRNVPAGLAYDSRRNRLFIANYLSNNILVAIVDLPAKTITVEEEFAADQVISPENVSTDPDTGEVAVADYDGNDVQIWAQEGAAWRRVCAIPLQQAHGIFLNRGEAFATGLANRELVKIDTSHCTISAQVGHTGWDPATYGFLWPTAVGEWDANNIAVADAHTGKLSIFDKESLAHVQSFGGNGPYLLNMPYGFTRARNGAFLILSTFGRQIVEVNSEGMIKRRYGGRQSASWDDAESLNRGNWARYRRLDKDASFLGRCVQPSYMGFLECGGDAFFKLPEPSENHLSGSSYFFFPQLASTERGWVLVSPQDALVIHLRKADLQTAILPLDVDSWITPDGILTLTGLVSFAAIDRAADAFIEGATIAKGSGAMSPRQAAAGLAAQLSGGEASAPWRRELKVPALRFSVPLAVFQKSIVASLSGLGDFTEATSSCAAEACDQDQLCRIADATIDRINKGSELRLGTLLSAAMLNPCVGRHYIARSAAR